MRKTSAMIIMLIGVGILFGGIFLWKWFVNTEIKKKQKENEVVIATVSATKATTSVWNSELKIVGSSRTVKGVNVTPELAGMITKIDFTPGAEVEEGKLLVQLDIAPDVAKLHQLEAQAMIAGITMRRNQKQFKVGGVSKETLDRDTANFLSTTAQVEEQKAVIAKKTVRAPFAGRLGVSMVNPGQFLNPGDNIVTLETLKPIYIDFYVPQQEVPRLKVGQTISISLDSYPSTNFSGPITTINPIVDKEVRNILVEATLTNDDEKILPGMFAYVTLETGNPKTYITLPQMAITFNPYGSIVYTLLPTTQKHQGQSVWKVHQEFVSTGDMRGNQVAVLKGVKEGDMVVTSGQLKIKDGSYVVINNTIQPSDNPNPNLPTE